MANGLPPNTIVIDDTNFQNFVPPPAGMSKGYRGMWRPGCNAPKPFGDLGVPLIPESEWKDRIRDQETHKSNLYHFSKGMGLPCLDQNGTNYCWINGPVHCMEIMRLQETSVVFSLSPASAGARIKNFRNVGGWGSQGLEWMIPNGVNTNNREEI